MARLVVIAPGRGTYNRGEMGYLERFRDHPRFDLRRDIVARADDLRASYQRISASEMDGAESFRSSLHLPGENASALIFTCTAADHALLNPEHEVVAVLGNSMGWYSTLFTGGALAFEQAFRVVETMGWHQKDNIRGGQLIYPVVDSEWRRDIEAESRALEVLDQVKAMGEEFDASVSIRLGGFLVLAGTDRAVKLLLEKLPKVKLGANEYPFQLARHAAFHTPLMAEASNHGLYRLSSLPWAGPKIPMIDGTGAIWRAHQSSPADLRDYTLIHQVLETFDFTAALRVAIREYNPDHLVLLGPGETLGGAIAHVIIDEGWRGIHDKRGFSTAQTSDHPPLIAMNRPDQAALVI